MDFITENGHIFFCTAWNHSLEKTDTYSVVPIEWNSTNNNYLFRFAISIPSKNSMRWRKHICLVQRFNCGTNETHKLWHRQSVNINKSVEWVDGRSNTEKKKNYRIDTFDIELTSSYGNQTVDGRMVCALLSLLVAKLYAQAILIWIWKCSQLYCAHASWVI